MDYSSKNKNLTKLLGIKESTTSALLSYADITPMDATSDIYDVIKRYFYQSQVKEHLDENGWRRLRLCQIYKVCRPIEQDRFISHHYVNDLRLFLWHGSGKKNLISIMKYGIIKSGTPGMFGTGIYFADRVTMSAHYCNNVGANRIIEGRNSIFLCSVAVGNMYEMTEPDYSIIKPPDGFDSVKAVGMYEPDPTDDIITPKGTVVKTGRTTTNPKVKEPDLLYNEYIVYTQFRVKIAAIIAFEPE